MSFRIFCVIAAAVAFVLVAGVLPVSALSGGVVVASIVLSPVPGTGFVALVPELGFGDGAGIEVACETPFSAGIVVEMLEIHTACGALFAESNVTLIERSLETGTVAIST